MTHFPDTESVRVNELTTIGILMQRLERGQIVVPKYQRGLVWDMQQKKELIDSIRRGYPFGSLLFHRDNITQRYILVDGLQRFNTIMQYSRNPTAFFDPNDVDPEFVRKLVRGFTKTPGVVASRRFVKDWVVRNWRRNSSLQVHDLITDFEIYFDTKERPESGIRKIIHDFLDKLQASFNISDIHINVIYYEGDKEHLPEIFQRINRTGTMASSYDVFAATWSYLPLFKIPNRELIDQIHARYKELTDQGNIIEDSGDTDLPYEAHYSLFEYMSGLSRLLTNKYPRIFSQRRLGTKIPVESIAFQIVGVGMGGSANTPEKLPEFFFDGIFDPEEIQRSGFPDTLTEEQLERVAQRLTVFENALFDSIAFLESVLEPFIGFSGNKDKTMDSVPLIVHTNNLAVAFVGMVLNAKYDRTKSFTLRPEWIEKEDLFERHIPYWYLAEVLSGRSYGLHYIGRVASGNEFREPLYIEDWDAILDTWFSRQLTRTSVRRTASNAEQLFLKYIYTWMVSHAEDASRSVAFNLEHLVPHSVLQQAIPQGGPFSHVANLCLMDQDLNRRKGNLTIYQYFNREIDNGNLTRQEAERQLRQIEKFTFTKETDLDFVPSLMDQPERYEHFLRERFRILKKEFYKRNRITHRPVLFSDDDEVYRPAVGY